MIKIDMEMPECCIKCPFYSGSRYGGTCAASDPDGLYFGGEWPDAYRHTKCPLQEENENV